MAFNIKNVYSLGGNAKAGKVPNMYLFWNEDGDTVTTASYFAVDSVTVGDQVTEISDDYTTRTNYRVSAVASGLATLVANA